MTGTDLDPFSKMLRRLMDFPQRRRRRRRALLARLDHVEQFLARMHGTGDGGPAFEPGRSPAKGGGEAGLRAELDHIGMRRRQGHLIEVDYALDPKVRIWSAARGNDHCRPLIEAGAASYCELLRSSAAAAASLARISFAEPADEREPWWGNPWFSSVDAICLTTLLVKLNPRCYVEVGSGNSTKFVRRAIADHGLRTKIISIDPHPRAIVDELCDQVIRKKLEDCDLGVFADLGAEDIVFIDNSHRSFQNSDVTVYFTEVLPMLKSGCHYGIHDIFLPNDYPGEWLGRYYNEQYLLMSYLLGGAAGDRIVLPVHYVLMVPELLGLLDPILKHPALGGLAPSGGGFFMRKA